MVGLVPGRVHAHGGQVALPLYGALITFSKFGKKYEAGLYREGQTSLYVNRGLGMSNLPLRFGAPPEVALLVLTGGGQLPEGVRWQRRDPD